MIALLLFQVSLATAVTILHCNDKTDECLLSKLKITNLKQEIILNSYNILNNEYMDNALIWMYPLTFFSNSFMQQITSKKQPTNGDFRDSFYDNYIKMNNLTLILHINGTQSDVDVNTQYIKHIIAKYRFDGFTYTDNINATNPPTKNNRMLLGDPSDSLTFDILNQHTWDEYDWFLYAFGMFLFGSFCLFCGWCCHKEYIVDKIVQDTDIEQFKTPISPSYNDNGEEKKYSFAGFNIFGEKIQYNEYTHRIPIPSQTDNSNAYTPTLHSVTVQNLSIADSQVSDTDFNTSQTNATTAPVIYETDNAVVQVLNPKSMPPPLQPPLITLPSKETNIVPKYKSVNPNLKSPQTAGVASPDSAEPSESHVIVEMFLKRMTSAGSDSENRNSRSPINKDLKYTGNDLSPIGLEVIAEANENTAVSSPSCSDQIPNSI